MHACARAHRRAHTHRHTRSQSRAPTHTHTHTNPFQVTHALDCCTPLPNLLMLTIFLDCRDIISRGDMDVLGMAESRQGGADGEGRPPRNSRRRCVRCLNCDGCTHHRQSTLSVYFPPLGLSLAVRVSYLSNSLLRFPPQFVSGHACVLMCFFV